MSAIEDLFCVIKLSGSLLSTRGSVWTSITPRVWEGVAISRGGMKRNLLPSKCLYSSIVWCLVNTTPVFVGWSVSGFSANLFIKLNGTKFRMCTFSSPSQQHVVRYKDPPRGILPTSLATCGGRAVRLLASTWGIIGSNASFKAYNWVSVSVIPYLVGAIKVLFSLYLHGLVSNFLMCILVSPRYWLRVKYKSPPRGNLVPPFVVMMFSYKRRIVWQKGDVASNDRKYWVRNEFRTTQLYTTWWPLYHTGGIKLIDGSESGKLII